MINWFKKRKGSSNKEIQESFKLNFKICFPIRNGTVETRSMDILVPAKSKKEAEKKLKDFVLKKIEVKIIDDKEFGKAQKDWDKTKQEYNKLSDDFDIFSSDISKIFDNFGSIFNSKKPKK